MQTAHPPVAPTSVSGSSLGVTAAPFIGSGAAVALDLAGRAERLGYDSFWVAEVTGTSRRPRWAATAYMCLTVSTSRLQ